MSSLVMVVVGPVPRAILPCHGHSARPHMPFPAPWQLFSSDVSALSDARFQEELCPGTMVWRAFDKAVRRKPPVVAADAGPMEIQLREGAVWRCAETVRQSTTDDSGR